MKKAPYNFFIIHKKWVSATPMKKLIIKKNRDVIPNREKDYYENDKERLREQTEYRKLSEEEKNKKREYGRNRYRDMSKEKKQKLKEYQKKYRLN